MTQVTRDLI